MPINLANINISLQQFQKISSGKFNAGEIRITGRTSLGKVNDHVSRIGKNTVPLSHEEVMAVKGAFIKALLAGGVGNDEINRVRREIGLAPDQGDWRLRPQQGRNQERQEHREGKPAPEPRPLRWRPPVRRRPPLVAQLAVRGAHARVFFL